MTSLSSMLPVMSKMQQVTRMTRLACQQYHFHKALYNLTKSNAHSTTSKTSHETTKPTRIAILGGGITGLTAAFYARKRFPDATITLFESTHRLGGVIDSITTHIDNNTSAVCDTGTRTLRANAPRGIVTLDLLHALNLTPLILPVPTASPAARTRYILSPTTRRPIPIPMPSAPSSPSHNPNPNHLLPHTLSTLLASTTTTLSLSLLLHPSLHDPLLRPLLPALLHDAFLAPLRPAAEGDDDGDDDESVHAFLTRRLGTSRIADGVASAVLMGSWAGDVRRLSARACVRELWEAEGRLLAARGGGGWWGGLGFGRGVVGEAVRRETAMAGEEERMLLRAVREQGAGEVERGLGVERWCVYGVRGGLGVLVKALEGWVRGKGGVEVVVGGKVGEVRMDEQRGDVAVKVAGGERLFTHVVACTPLNHLLACTEKSMPLRMQPMEEVTVAVVTLCYAHPRLNHPYQGFGYLIPRSVPHELNPERAIGVVFDSDVTPGIDEFQGTKITVVLGGCWWTGVRSYPDEVECERMARRTLEMHLGLTEEPAAVVVTLQKDAIPQYTVGHHKKLSKLRKALLDAYQGRLRVAGKSYRGISVHDCIFSARSVIESLDREMLTGLEEFSNVAE